MDNEGMHAFACKLRANCSRYSIYRQLERTWFPNENRSREISHEGQRKHTWKVSTAHKHHCIHV